MPLFEYQCRDCNETFELLQGQAEQEVACPRCGSAAKRVVSLFAGSVESGSGCAAPGGSGFG